MIRGKLVVFEGVDGAGTTTQTELLRKKFVEKGLPAAVAAQPSTGPVGVMIRQILSGRLVTIGNRVPGWTTMSLLFAADRQDQQENEIEPNRRDGVNVVSDRYVQSSAIYQSIGTQSSNSVDWILELNKHIAKPDVVFFLKIDPDEAARRRASRDTKEDIFDDAEFQKKLVDGYNRLEEIFPETNIVTIDACLSPEEISQRAWDVVEEIRNSGADL